METLVWNPRVILFQRPLVPPRTIPYTSSQLSCHVTPFSFRRRPRRRIGFYFSSSIGNKLGITCAGGVREINESQFPEVVLSSDRPVLVEFVANWCGPCRLISPSVESLAQEYKEKLTIVKIDHDSNPRLIEEYKVYGLPTLILFKDGQEVLQSRREGAITKVKLKEYVDALFEFVKEAGRGGKGNLPLESNPTIMETEPWDGKDGEIIEEDEFSLEELMGEESSNRDEL